MLLQSNGCTAIRNQLSCTCNFLHSLSSGWLPPRPTFQSPKRGPELQRYHVAAFLASRAPAWPARRTIVVYTYHFLIALQCLSTLVLVQTFHSGIEACILIVWINVFILLECRLGNIGGEYLEHCLHHSMCLDRLVKFSRITRC